jgi:hypothetical protein
MILVGLALMSLGRRLYLNFTPGPGIEGGSVCSPFRAVTPPAPARQLTKTDIGDK